jgi:RNA polymerase sigma-70 factor (family 1)
VKETPVTDLENVLDMGNVTVFEQVFLRYYAALCDFASRYLHDKADAEDIVESIFIVLWNSKEQFADHNHARSYLYRATYNRCLNSLRGHKRTMNREAEFIRETGVTEESYLHHMLRAELIAMIYREIDKLPEQYARILRLSYQEGLRNEDIASRVGLSLQTVKNYKSKGMELLRRRLPKNVSLLLLASLLG